jgi:hypothetical protein
MQSFQNECAMWTPKKSWDSDLYPKLFGFIYCLKRHEPTVRSTRDHKTIALMRDGPSTRLQLSIEELIEGFETIYGVRNVI